MKHFTRYLYARLLSVIAMLFALSWQATPLRAQESTSYIQFSGVGRTVLYADDAGRVSAEVVANGFTSTESGYHWTVVAVKDSVTLRDASGRYLVFSGLTFKTTASADSATRFFWTKNTYYDETSITRHQLVIANQSQWAVGVRQGKLQRVLPNSRYAVIYQAADKVQGPDLPNLNTSKLVSYYRINTQWGADPVTGKDNLYTNGNDVQVKTWANDDVSKWSLAEVNDLGDVTLRNKAGKYLKQASANDYYVATEDFGEAVKFQLVEAVDQGQLSWTNAAGIVENIANQYWYQFWQLKNTANNTYFFEGDGNKMGGYNNPTSHFNYKVGLGSYNFAFNRLRFVELNETESNPLYLQFSAMGRKVLTVSDGGIQVSDVKSTLTTPDFTRWDVESVSGGQVVLKTSEGKYLQGADGGFSLVDAQSEATRFTQDISTFYHGDAADRYTFTRADDASKALGLDEDGALAWVNPASRGAVVRLEATVKGVDAPVVSVSLANAKWYNLRIWYGNQSEENTLKDNKGNLENKPNFLYEASASEVKVTSDDAYLDHDRYMWTFLKADNLGHVYVVNRKGEYLRQAAPGTSTR